MKDREQVNIIAGHVSSFITTTQYETTYGLQRRKVPGRGRLPHDKGLGSRLKAIIRDGTLE